MEMSVNDVIEAAVMFFSGALVGILLIMLNRL